MLGVAPEGESEGNAALIGALPGRLERHRTDVEFVEHRGKNALKRAAHLPNHPCVTYPLR